MCLPLLIFPCTIKSRSSLLAPAHPGGPGKRAVKRLVVVRELTYDYKDRSGQKEPANYVQEEFLVPDGIKLLRNGLRAFFGLAHLNRHVRVACTGFVFADQALSTDHCAKQKQPRYNNNMNCNII